LAALKPAPDPPLETGQGQSQWIQGQVAGIAMTSFRAYTAKGKRLNPINTQYDLYSTGEDGQSKLPLTAPQSRDDVILAYDGNYVGLASDF